MLRTGAQYVILLDNGTQTKENAHARGHGKETRRMKRILLIFLMIAAASVPFAAANADTETTAAARPFLPATYEEYCELEELMDVYYDEGMTILSENDKVWVSRGNGYTAYEAPQKNVKMARRFQNDVLVQDSLVLYRLSLSDGTFTQVEDTNGSPITAGNFSLNDRYLAVTTNTDIRVYRITEAGFTPVRTVTTGSGAGQYSRLCDRCEFSLLSHQRR